MNNFVLGEITMSSMQEFFRRIKNRPFVYFGMLILTLFLGAVETYNPITKNYGSFSYILNQNYLDTLSGWTVKFGAFFDKSNAFSKILIALLLMM